MNWGQKKTTPPKKMAWYGMDWHGCFSHVFQGKHQNNSERADKTH
jgi:hypothetical protein